MNIAGLVDSLRTRIGLRCCMAGLLLRLHMNGVHMWEQPKDEQLFDDTSYWTLPDEGFPSCPAAEEHQQKEKNDKWKKGPVANI